MTIEHTGNVKMTPAEVADEYEKFFKSTSVVCRSGAARRTCIQYEEHDFAKTLLAPKPEEAPEFWCEVERELEKRGYWVEGDASDPSKVYLYRRNRKYQRRLTMSKTHLPGRAGRTLCGHPVIDGVVVVEAEPSCKLCKRLASPRGNEGLRIRGLSPETVTAFKEYMARHGHRTMAEALEELLKQVSESNNQTSKNIYTHSTI